MFWYIKNQVGSRSSVIREGKLMKPSEGKLFVNSVLNLQGGLSRSCSGLRKLMDVGDPTRSHLSSWIRNWKQSAVRYLNGTTAHGKISTVWRRSFRKQKELSYVESRLRRWRQTQGMRESVTQGMPESVNSSVCELCTRCLYFPATWLLLNNQNRRRINWASVAKSWIW